MFLLKCRAGVFTENVEIKISRTSDRITKRARETTTNALESEFPAAAVAFKVCRHCVSIHSYLKIPSKLKLFFNLETCTSIDCFVKMTILCRLRTMVDFSTSKCITKEAELMCAMLIHAAEDHPYWFVLCNKVRLYALRFMAYKEPEYILAAAAMMVLVLPLPKQTVIYFSINSSMFMTVLVLLAMYY